MNTVESIIETGVDRLVELIKSKGKVSIQEAAEALGVGTTVIEEWANFLEEEGIISIEYKLTTPYLALRHLTPEEVEHKSQEFHGKKDVFIRKAEVALHTLEKEASSLQKLRQEFDKIKTELSHHRGEVKEELKEMEQYQKLKRELDLQLSQQRRQMEQRFKEMDKQIFREQRRYQHILQEIVKEEKNIDQERSVTLSIKNMETSLQKRLQDLEATTHKIGHKIKEEDVIIGDSIHHVSRLKKLAEEIKQRAIQEKRDLEDLASRSKEHEKKILMAQNNLLKKIAKKKGAAKVEHIINNFESFFEKRLKTEELLRRINHERDELEHELHDLIRKARSFQLSSKSEDMGKHMIDLEKRFNEVDKKKEHFEKKLGQLIETVKL